MSAEARRLALGVLVSGRGSNLQALIDGTRHAEHPAEIRVVVSNRPAAHALERAAEAGIPTEVLDHREHRDRAAYDAAVVERLRERGVDLVCLAGFDRLLSPTFIRAFPNRILNVHPALLPAFKGLHAQRQALEYGVRVAGCTVHFVDEETDHGPILLQAAVPVLDDDDEASLSERILAEEHRLYPEAVRLVAEGRVRIEGRRVRIV